jgi:glutamine cyclotransferase
MKIKHLALLLALCSSVALSAQKKYTYRVLHSYPHDAAAYTQGLFFKNGTLYESTGQYGTSELRIVDLESGTVNKRAPLEQRYFAEGATILGNLIYQLTWREGICFVYDAKTLAPLYQLRYSGEGWGLTDNSKLLIMSDGSSTIRFLEPQTLREVRRINVHNERGNVALLNELELIDAELWANVYTTNQILRIDTATGKVLGTIDMTGILPVMLRTKNTDVLNGIAYDAKRKRIFVTGKNWSRLFEIEVIEKR